MAEINNHREFFEALLAGETVETYHLGSLMGSWRLDDKGRFIKKSASELDIADIPTNLEILRIKKKTLRIGEFDVPEPVRKPLDVGTEYYVTKPSAEALKERYVWADDAADSRLLKRGFIHLTQEAAELHAKALLSFTVTPSTDTSRTDNPAED